MIRPKKREGISPKRDVGTCLNIIFQRCPQFKLLDRIKSGFARFDLFLSQGSIRLLQDLENIQLLS